MAAQSGKDLLLKLDEAGTGSFLTMAGLRARTLSFNARAVDVTHSLSPGRWQELLEGAGVKSAALSGSGVFTDSAADAAVRQLFFAGAIRPWQIFIPDFGEVEGRFQITALQYDGNHERELTFDMALQSAGELTFSAL